MITKKIIIISVVILAVILIGGFGAYKLWLAGSDVQNAGDQEPVNTQEDSSEFGAPDIDYEVEGGGGLVICSDKCGDGVCQSTEDKECKNVNCVCLENRAECPQDCK